MKKYVFAAILCFAVAATAYTALTVSYAKDRESETKYAYAVSEYTAEEKDKYSIYGGIMENLAEKYPDICGWINVENTNICYPLLISKDNEHYLRKAYDGSEDKNGSIIVDYRLNSTLTENKNIILYGHNMISGNMFAYIANPENIINAQIEIYSNGVLSVYRPFSAYIESGNEFVKTSFGTDEELKNYIDTALSKTILDFGITPAGNERLLTLITCEDSYGLNNKRVVIHALLTEP